MCYTIPLAGFVVTSVLCRKKKKDVKIWWLNLMFCGGALFGVMDHLWNGELFPISKNIVKDLLLGIVITATLLGVWSIIVALTKYSPALAYYKE